MRDGYNYIATYVDDIIVVSDDPSQYVTELEQHFAIRNVDNMPHFYFGCNLKTMPNNIKILMTKYIGDILSRYQRDNDELKKQNTPIKTKVKPQLDESPLLNEEGITHYQWIIGICQWLVTAGRLDICFAVSCLSRYTSAPREGHLELA